MKKTYELASGPPPFEYEVYAVDANQKYKSLLSSEKTTEKDMQLFFENNSCFLPGYFPPRFSGGHCPIFNFLISQPRLSGLKQRIPDFMWFATHSAAWMPTLIEIESPHKTLFNKSQFQTAEFTQAANQLIQWKTWFNHPANVILFQKEYGIPDQITRFRKISPHYILIYGRRTEFENDENLSNLRSEIPRGNDEELVSFDRLEAHNISCSAITVKAVGNGKFKACGIMPTFRLGPNFAENLSILEDLEAVIELDSRIPTDRKRFLLDRLPYWKEWGQKSDRGIINGSDYE